MKCQFMSVSNIFSFIFYVGHLYTVHSSARYTSQETLRYPQIHRIGNRQFFCGIIEAIRGIVKGCPRNRQRVSAKLSKGVRGFVESHQHSQNCQRHPRNRTVPRIVEG